MVINHAVFSTVRPRAGVTAASVLADLSGAATVVLFVLTAADIRLQADSKFLFVEGARYVAKSLTFVVFELTEDGYAWGLLNSAGIHVDPSLQRLVWGAGAFWAWIAPWRTLIVLGSMFLVLAIERWFWLVPGGARKCLWALLENAAHILCLSSLGGVYPVMWWLVLALQSSHAPRVRQACLVVVVLHFWPGLILPWSPLKAPAEMERPGPVMCPQPKAPTAWAILAETGKAAYALVLGWLPNLPELPDVDFEGF